MMPLSSPPSEYSVKVKICGLSRPEDIDSANQLLPDYIGFVFAPRSRRFILPQTAASLCQKLNRQIRPVGVFVNEPLSSLEAILNRVPLDLIQLHGSEDNTYLSRIRQLTDCPLIQAFALQTAADCEKAMASSADFLLLDGVSAGSGVPFDWNLLTGINRPYFLAGGLSPDTLADALLKNSPFAVDVSSGVETNGKKDYHKMKAFIETARGFPVSGE